MIPQRGNRFSKKSRSNKKLDRGAPPARAVGEHERRPAVKLDAPFEDKRPVRRHRGIGLRRQETGDDDAAARGQQSFERRGDALQRAEQNVGEDEIEGRALRARLRP